MRIRGYIAPFFTCLFAMAAVLNSCVPNTEVSEGETPTLSASEKVNVVVQAEHFTSTQGQVETVSLAEGRGYTIAKGEENWLAFDVEIPTAGRYKLVLHASANERNATAWIEDYFDNTDDRTYNITGEIKLDSAPGEEGDFSQFSKTGSPLNAGIHKMKLHLKGEVKVDKFEFALVKAHQETPKTLTQKMDGEEWTLVWSDEFEETEIDTSKWTYDHGDWGWGNNELQYYTEDRKENARIANGNLIIEARKNDMGKEWTSARLTTRGKVSFIYGRIEFRAKVPKEKGNWAAGWTLGDNYIDELSWPYCGEIDILESVGYEMDNATGNGKAHASAHCSAYYFKLGNQPTGILEVENMNEEYHTYAVDWSPAGITASVDGKTYFNYNDTSGTEAWPFDKPQNIILNLTMGGGWGGLEGMDDSVTSQLFVIDYVRVYEKRQ